MSRQRVIRPAARADVLAQFEYLVEQDAPAAAYRFLEAFEDATSRILEMPGIGTSKELSNRRLRGLRSWPVPGFQAVRVYYLETPNAIVIVRVLHGMRDLTSILERE